MEILLLEDIVGIGKKNDLLVVGDGFALNFLLPGRKALVATPTVRKRYADQIRRRAEEKENERQLQHQAVQVLAGRTVTVERKATKAGKLYAAVSALDVAAALKDQHALEIPESAIRIEEPVKSVGTHQAAIKLGSQSPVAVTVVVKEAKK